MKTLIIAFVAVAALAAPSFALSPEAEAFIRSIGQDPNSAAVRAADKDGTISTTFRGDPVAYSLESLAHEKKKNGVLAFITTRAFIKKLAVNPSTPFPKPYYDGMYLTSAERDIVTDKLTAES